MIAPKNFVGLTRAILAAVENPVPVNFFEVLNVNHELLNLSLELEKDKDKEDLKNWIQNEQIPNLI